MDQVEKYLYFWHKVMVVFWARNFFPDLTLLQYDNDKNFEEFGKDAKHIVFNYRFYVTSFKNHYLCMETVLYRLKQTVNVLTVSSWE